MDKGTLPVIISNIIFQEVGYFENSTISSSLRVRPLCFYVATKIQGLKNDNSKVIYFEHKIAMYASTPAVHKKLVT